MDSKPDVKVVFDVVVSDPLRVDLDVFQLWLQGYSGTLFLLIEINRIISLSPLSLSGTVNSSQALHPAF
jgi:hypothetical protein